MSERKRRLERRARWRAAEAAKPLPTAQPPANRGTFRVAQAQRQLAADLPSVVRNRQSEKPRATRPRSPLDPLSPVDQGAAKRSPSRTVELNRTEQPKLSKGDAHLKCRPKSNKPVSGGSGRSFIPWREGCG